MKFQRKTDEEQAEAVFEKMTAEKFSRTDERHQPLISRSLQNPKQIN